MVFHDKYELLVLRNGNGEIALTGREIVSGRPVVVHLLTARPDEVLTGLRGLPESDRRHVLETGDHEGIPYVITDALPGNADLESWLESSVKVPAPAPAEPGEFTRLFASPIASTEKPAEPGEFTRMLSGDRISPAHEGVSGGEFTRVFGAEQQSSRTMVELSVQPLPQGATGAVVSEPASRSSPAEPSEFTRMFAAPPPPKIAAPDPAPPPPQTTAPPKPAAKSKVPLIAGLGGLFLLIMILVVVFALTR